MCQDSDPRAEIEFNNLFLNFHAHPCAITPIRAILNNLSGDAGCFERTPVCQDSDMCDPEYIAVGVQVPTCASQHTDCTHQLGAHALERGETKRGKITAM